MGREGRCTPLCKMRPQEVVSRTRAGRELKPKRSLCFVQSTVTKDGTSEDMRQEGLALKCMK